MLRKKFCQYLRAKVETNNRTVDIPVKEHIVFMMIFQWTLHIYDISDIPMNTAQCIYDKKRFTLVPQHQREFGGTGHEDFLTMKI